MTTSNDMTISVLAPQGGEFGTLDMSITISQDTNLEQLMTTFERIAMALTYSPVSWRKVVMDMAEGYKYEQNLENHNA